MTSKRPTASAKTTTERTTRIHLGREALLLFLSSYVILIAGGFGALVDFRRQALSVFLAVAVLGGWLVVRLFSRQRIHGSKIDWAIVAFLGSQFVSVMFSEDVRRSLPHTSLWLVYFIIFYFSLDTMRRGWKPELYMKSLLITGAILLVFASADLGKLYADWRRLTAGLEFAPRFQQRLGTVLGDPNLLAAFTNLLLPLAVGRYLVSSSNGARAALRAYSGLSFVVLFFTDSRGGLLGFGASMAAFSIMWVHLVSNQAKAQVRRWTTWFWGRKLLLLVVVILLTSLTGFAAWSMLSFQGDTTHAPVAEARDIYWEAATNAMRTDPVTGAGPGMYPIYLMKIWSTPPARPYLHAHSAPFQLAAESGILGLAAGAFLVLSVVRHARESWRDMEMDDRAIRAAALASVVGLSAHSLVDDFFKFPAIGVTTMILLAIIMRPGQRKQNYKTLSPWLFAIPVVVIGLLGLYSLKAFLHADQAVAFASRSEWEAAAEEMLRAANSDPAFGFYWLQAGKAYGMLAAEDPDFLDRAITSYQHGIELEPVYALNHANLGALFWANSQTDDGLEEMRVATTLAPESWLFWLNRGVLEEQAGLIEAALVSYQRAINLRPEILGAASWRMMDVRSMAARFDPDLFGPIDVSRAIVLVHEAREFIKGAEFDAVLPLFEEVYRLNDQEIRLYLGLSELAFANGELDKAEQYAQLALWIPATSNNVKVEVVLLAAEISLAQGNQMESLRRYQVSYDLFFQDASYGWGSAGWSPYAWFVWQRPAFSEDMLPFLQRADITIEIASRLMPITELYEANGDTQMAQSLREELLLFLP